MERRPFEIFDSFAGGVILSIACQIGVAAICFGLARIWAIAILAVPAWGLTQWLVVVPLAYRLKRVGKTWIVKGLLAGSFIGVLLSSACGAWAYMVISALRYHTIPH